MLHLSLRYKESLKQKTPELNINKEINSKFMTIKEKME